MGTKAILLGLLLFVFSCGVKEREEPLSGPPSPVTNGNLPEGMWVTKDRKFLIRPSTTVFRVGQQTVSYKVATNDLELLSSPDYTVQVKYLMPRMPEMPVEPAVVDLSTPGLLKITYDISMGGVWDFSFSFSKKGIEIDSLSHSYKVPE